MDDVIREKLLQRMLDGTYKWGGKLPSENTLAEEFHVPRITVRKALIVLEDMGYIYSRQGKGRFLRNKKTLIPLNLTGQESFTDKLTRANFNLETSTISELVIKKDPKIMKRLGAADKENIYSIRRLRLLYRQPVAIHISFLREALFPDIGKTGDQIDSLFAYFRKHGYSDFKSTKSLMSVSLPTVDEQMTLGCPPLVPLLVLESDTIDGPTNKMLQVTRILYRSDLFQYEID